MLSREEEARYGYLAAVNSTTLADGVALDLGGGSMQLTRVRGPRRRATSRSWPLGAVRMTERFLPGEQGQAQAAQGAARRTSRDELERGAVARRDGRARWPGIGGTVRNLAAAAQLAAELPSFGVQGFALARDALDELIERFAEHAAGRARRRCPGIKPERGDLILAGALVDPDA